jgi:TolA-binding protein
VRVMGVGHPRLPARMPFRVGLLLLLALGSWSCAFYNTYYMARKYYMTATGGLPYMVEKPVMSQAATFQKSIDYSKKVLGSYPKSKWADDAYLLWARALLGKEDPLETASLLQDFSGRFPGSPLKEEATFYLGVAYRQARKYREALVPLDEFLEKAPRSDLAPYAHLERALALASLKRNAEAAQAASQVVERFGKSGLEVRARAARAEALLASGDAGRARDDYRELGQRARDDDERFTFLLREADCLEAARDYPGELALLNNALSHEPAPPKSAGGAVALAPGADRYGRLTLRIGTVHLLAGRQEQALASYRDVVQDYPKTALSAEAQYRIGYAYETVLDDFDAARQEYAKVRDQSASSVYFTQANQRQQSLDRLAGYRSAGRDSSDRKVEAGFLLAEQYLFQLDKPERAIEAYNDVIRDHQGTEVAAKALNAEAWVLRRKFDRPGAADSLLWRVVREYPGTEAQLAARDYLESAGHSVPAELIKPPVRKIAPADTTLRLTPPPPGSMPLGTPPRGVSPAVPAEPDSAARTPAPAPRAPTIGPLRPAPGRTQAPLPAAPSAPGAGRTGEHDGSPLDDPPRPAPGRGALSPPDTSRVRP